MTKNDSLMNRRNELLRWFQERASSLAGGYEGAIRLLKDKDFPGRQHFISHAVRDIVDRLPFALDPQNKGSRVQYENEMDKIEKQWPTLQTFGNSNSNPDAQETVSIDYKLAYRINSLVEAHRKRKQQPSNFVLLFRYLLRNEPSKAQVNERVVEDLKEVRKWFMERAHLRANQNAKVDESELQKQFEKFEAILHSFVGNFFTNIGELNEILQQANQ